MIIAGDKPAKANVLKLAANMILATNLSLFGQVYALNERWDIDSDVTQQMLGIFYSYPGLLAYEERIKDRNYSKPAGEGFGVSGGLKDVNAVINAGEKVGVPLPFCSTIREQYISAIGYGLSDLDWSALGDVTRLQAGSSVQPQKKD